MIRQMRRRVILAAMVAFLAVILLIGGLVNVMNYLSVTRRVDQSLQMISGFESGDTTPPDFPQKEDKEFFRKEDKSSEREEPPKNRPLGLPDVEANYMTRFFIVRYDAEGAVEFVSTDYVAAIDDEGARTLAAAAMKKSGSKGYLDVYRFLKVQTQDKTEVIFVNASRELRDIRSLLLQTLIISLLSLLLVFVLVVLLSHRAIRPFADNITRQKQFITDASHELKTPLTSIGTSLDIICMEHGEDEWTDNIRQQTGRMSHLVSELVALSRLDEEHPLPQKEQFSLSDTAWEMMGVYEPQAKASGRKLEADISDHVEMVGDVATIQQLISVLLENAIRYSNEAGEIRFSVSRKGSKAAIEVFNTCQLEVIPDPDKLFDRFYRPDGARSTKTGGTGIGLAIAKAVVTAHGGTITASCPDGRSMTIRAVL